VDVLFDSGATHSFISVKLVETLGLNPMQKCSLLSVVLPGGKAVSCELYEGCHIKMHESEFPTDLYKFELTNLGVILGMDYLAKNQAQIDCPKRKITLKGPHRRRYCIGVRSPEWELNW